MYKIPWGTGVSQTKNSITADIGDIRLTLKLHPQNWVLSMGIRVYTKDGLHSMVRPPVTVLQIPLPCEMEEAKVITQEYLNNFLASILSTLT